MKLGIIGYGNLGKGVEAAVNQNPDIDLEVHPGGQPIYYYIISVE